MDYFYDINRIIALVSLLKFMPRPVHYLTQSTFHFFPIKVVVRCEQNPKKIGIDNEIKSFLPTHIGSVMS